MAAQCASRLPACVQQQQQQHQLKSFSVIFLAAAATDHAVCCCYALSRAGKPTKRQSVNSFLGSSQTCSSGSSTISDCVSITKPIQRAALLQPADAMHTLAVSQIHLVVPATNQQRRVKVNRKV
jgi:hypothetical protein